MSDTPAVIENAQSHRSIYDDVQDRIAAAYGAFEGVYRMQHPEPAKPSDAKRDYATLVSLTVIVLAALIVSGSRTIDEFSKQGGNVVGTSAFFMLEITSLVLAYIRAKRGAFKNRREGTRLVSLGMYIAFTVMIVANLDATLRAGGVVVSEYVNLFILVAVALSAPTLVLICGDVLGIEFAKQQAEQHQIDDAHAAALVEWRESMLRSWEAQKGRWGATVKIESEAVPAVSTLSNGTSNGNPDQQALPAASTLGHKKVPNASKIAREYFQANPDLLADDTLNLVELAQTLGIGKSTVYAVRNEMVQEQNAG